MVYGIVRQSKGFIDVESELGTGTLVRLLLPLAEETPVPILPPATPSDESTEGPSAERKRLTILLAEDEPSVRRFLRTILSRDGHAVLEAENGRIGAELAAQFDGPIDLVVSDVLMPELGGPDMIREVRRTRPTVRVLFISGYTDLQSLADDDAGASRTRYLPKPFSTGQLMEAVRGTLLAP